MPSSGFENYLWLFRDPDFLNSILMTVKFTFIVTPLQIVLAVFVALLFNRNHLFVRVSRTIVYIPVAINMVVASTVWNLTAQSLLRSDQLDSQRRSAFPHSPF